MTLHSIVTLNLKMRKVKLTGWESEGWDACLGMGCSLGGDPRKQSAGGEWNRTEEPTQELSLSWELITTRFPKVPLRNHEEHISE